MILNRIEVLEEIPMGFIDTVKNKKIVIVGCGGVGSPLANILVRSGFENLVLVDNDFVDESNLQRQIYTFSSVGKSKCEELKKSILEINKNADIKTFFSVLNKNNIEEICGECDLVVDCTDNFETRKIINLYCEEAGKDWIFNGAIRHEIVFCTFYGKDKKFSKVFPNEIKDQSCQDVGVLASTTFTSASFAYNQILKYFLGTKEDKLFKMNLWTYKTYEVNLK